VLEQPEQVLSEIELDKEWLALAVIHMPFRSGREGMLGPGQPQAPPG